jgi:uncharacterized protein YuzE
MITYDHEVDAVYVYLSDERVVRTKIIDDLRIADYDAEGRVVGMEFLGASSGLDLRDLPEHEGLEAELRFLIFPIVT